MYFLSKGVFIKLFFLLVLAHLGQAALAQPIPSGRDRFCARPSESTEQLAARLQADPTFRRNLAQHFALPEARVVAFVKEALVPYTLPASATVMNYGVTKAGTIYGRKTLLKKGTRVWATRSGKPILKWDCSNPLLPSLPVLRSRPRTAPVQKAQSAQRVRRPELQERAPQGIEVAPVGVLAYESPVERRAAPGLAPKPGASTLDLRLPLAGVGVVGLSRIASSRPARPVNVPEPGTLSLGLLGLLALFLRRTPRA